MLLPVSFTVLFKLNVGQPVNKVTARGALNLNIQSSAVQNHVCVSVRKDAHRIPVHVGIFGVSDLSLSLEN